MKQSGPRVERRCLTGCLIIPVLVVGQGMKDMCACRGYKPIDITAPYQLRQAQMKVGGKARIWFEYPKTVAKARA